MGTSDVLRVLKIALAYGSCNLRTLNHEMHEQVHTISFIYYILNKIAQMRYFVRVTYYIKRFNGFQYAHMFYLNQSEI